MPTTLKLFIELWLCIKIKILLLKHLWRKWYDAWELLQNKSGRSPCGGSKWNKAGRKLITAEADDRYVEILHPILSALKTFNFDIITYSREVPRKCTERSMYSLVLTSCITIMQWQNQKIYISIINRTYSDSISCTYTRVCVCVNVVLSHVVSCSHHHYQDIELFHHHKSLLCYSF